MSTRYEGELPFIRQAFPMSIKSELVIEKPIGQVFDENERDTYTSAVLFDKINFWKSKTKQVEL